MTETIKYTGFFLLFALIISQFLPVVSELPYGIETHIATAAGMIRQLFVCVPFLETPYEIFKLSLQLIFYYAMFKVLMFFLTRGQSGSNI